ncbi:hypothetical protein SLEP1_g179 [Rubroshorea leprosula]|uniref:Uncharacterized protein n=1 Tax=Rubroshorea leprosula TaxID=152421 RepID=A0AAV5HED7_9ROSI|nr:hypothetical protein SLEP1_g179 [Rubroshorea leprosula]
MRRRVTPGVTSYGECCSFDTTTPTLLLGVKAAGNKKFT